MDPEGGVAGVGGGGGVGNISFLGGGRTNLFCILLCKFGNLGGGGACPDRPLDPRM